jgi:replicative DNA helicase
MIRSLAERQPPHNFEAEQAVLGSIMANNAAFSQVSEMLSPRHFADPLHGRLYEALGRLVERGQVVSAFTLKAYAESDEGLKAAGGPAYLAKLAATSVHALDVPAAARTVRDCATRRGLIGVLSEALPAAYDEAHEAAAAEQIEGLERRLYELADGAVAGGLEPFRSALTEAVKSAEAAHSRPGGMTGLGTGLHDLDEQLGGLNRSDLIIVAARPGMGKSALASNIGFAAARQGAVAGFFSLEMSAEQLANRIVAEQAGVASERVRRGQLTGVQFDRVIEVAAELERLPIFMDDTPALSISALRTRARRQKRLHGLDLVIVDYLQLIDGGKRRQENRVQEVSEISRGLKTLAKELDVPVLALSQLSRAVEQRPDKRPQLADLRDSGSIEQDADVVIFIYREEYYLERGSAEDRARLGDVAGRAELHVAKQRHGPTGLVRVMFDGPTTRFSDVDRSDR